MARFPTLALLLALAATGQAATADGPVGDKPASANEFCPVMTDQPADPAHQIQHGGRTVSFCCGECVRRFKADPAAYEANLPPLPPPPPQVESWDEVALRRLRPAVAAAEWVADRWAVSVYLTGLGVLAAVALRKRRAARAAGRAPTLSDRVTAPFARPHTLVTLALIGVCVHLATATPAPTTAAPSVGGTDTARYDHVLHYAWPQGFHELPRGVKNTYYRGNDERSPELFNGGNYRTATYHLSLRTEDGSEVEPTRAVAGQRLVVRCEIDRAPNTAPQFYSPKAMGGVFFLRSVRSTDFVRLTTTKPDWRWVADLPLGTPAADGYSQLRGAWMMYTNGAGDPPAVSVATPLMNLVQYALHFQDGRLDGRSVVWMVSAFPSPILTGPESDGQWFSDRPIPEIPDGRGVTDPRLLGLTHPATAPKQKGKE